MSVSHLRVGIIRVSGKLLGNCTGTQVNYFRISKMTNHGYNDFDKTQIRKYDFFSVFGFSIKCMPGITAQAGNCSNDE